MTSSPDHTPDLSPAAPSANPSRCDWCLGHDLEIRYHDTEWGVPLHDDTTLLEFLILEGAQAGLSWLTVLKRREGYRRAFAGFDPATIAAFDDDDVARLLADPGIIRNRLKVHSAINNARVCLQVQQQYGSLDAYLWRFVDGTPIRNHHRTMADLPAVTPLANTISKEMKRTGFTFVGPTIVYATMQAIGMVNDHIVSCFRHRQLGGAD